MTREGLCAGVAAVLAEAVRGTGPALHSRAKRILTPLLDMSILDETGEEGGSKTAPRFPTVLKVVTSTVHQMCVYLRRGGCGDLWVRFRQVTYSSV